MTTEAPTDPKANRPITLDEFFTLLEARLRSACAGKTLLGEIAFTEENCDNVEQLRNSSRAMGPGQEHSS
jgi:hypothetical protein